VSDQLAVVALCACVLLLAVYSGGETGLYSLSRARLEAGLQGERRSAHLVRRLLRDETGLLITLLVASQLVVLAATNLAGHFAERLFPVSPLREIALTLLLAPPLFFLGELLPKDLFRRRPHALVGHVAPAITATKVALWPLTLPLRGLTSMLSRVLGLDVREMARVQGREAVLELVRERDRGRAAPMEALARNVLELRSVRVERVMVPWRRVVSLPEGLSAAELRARVGRSTFTRLPVVGRRGAVRGYVHQLEVLAAPPGTPIEQHLRPLLTLEPSMPLDRALARLRQSGQRAALVGSADSPLGLVTLKDLVEEISGELRRW
jgi:CBS domain containing-hemolysin-like protein